MLDSRNTSNRSIAAPRSFPPTSMAPKMIATRPLSLNGSSGGSVGSSNNNSSTQKVSVDGGVTEKAKKTDATKSIMSSINGSSSPRRTAAPLVSIAVQTPTQGTTTALLVQPETAVRVIKGEIHNVLCQFRGDQRYVSSSRFREEILEDKEQHHPVVQHFQDLHAALSEWEPEVSVSMSSAAMAQQHPLDPMMYLPVFCAAVTGREISAPVTGAALSALHKFLIYGFLVPDSFNAAAGMTEIANALLNCTFEESPADEAPNQRRTSKAMVAAGTSTAPTSSTRRRHDDEQVVLKLLEMSALVVRCSLQSINLIQADLVVGLLDTCLHVSHRASRASPLLKSAAVDSLSQIVLQVFAGTGEPVMQARRDILQQLAALLNPAMHNESVTVSSLTAVNIALETCREDLQPAEIEILQNDLCKYLLQWTTTDDQVILSLTLRVIFNLFQSIRNHLKVPLEVFFTSVHLRILDTSQVTAPPEQREIALESLLEFCQEPALMQDLYLNYDCDVACTNMYEHVVAALGKTAIPAGWAQPSQANKKGGGSNHGPASGSNNNINGGGGAKAVEAVATGGVLVPNANGSSSTAPVAVVSTESSLALANPNTAPVNALERLATEGILAVLDSIARRCQGGTGSYGSRMSSFDDIESMAYSEVKSEEEREWESQESDLEELHTRKQKKHSMFRLAQAFNAEPIKKEWRELAVAEKLLEKMDDPAEISNLLYTTPGLDKTQLGLYLSKGPDNKYPLEASVRSRFVEHFDFTGMTFAAALRKFLSKFRLPGEAQCIDRLMEAFSKELFQQQGESTFFKNADAVYVLSFSTIMLNTDLHNPTIKSENRMTLVQFIRNNRGINGGDDLPEDFLTELYGQIKDIQIQVRRELGECMKKHEHGDIRATWEEVLSKNEEVATPFFTPAARARRNMSRAGVHDKEMFLVLSSWALKSLPGIFKRSWDDALVVKALRGMQQMAKIAVFFELDSIVDDILKELLPLGRDYVVSCVTWDYANTDGGASVASTNNRTVESVETAEEDEHDPFDSDQPIPYDLLCTSESGENDIDIAGSATNRGLLALDCSFVLLRKYASRVTDSWPAFIECLCALRDARALPAGLSDLDDFADSNGNVLPLSSFAKTSQRKLDEYYRSQSDQDADKKKSWFRSFFDKKNAKALEEEDSMAEDDGSVAPNKGELSKYTRVLLAIAEAADVENVVQMGSTKLPTAEQTIRSLLATVDQYPYKKDPVMEQHAIFSLELAARALLSNRDRAPELFNLFLDKFESILGRVTDKKVPAPFVIERIVVTILRCSIHLYELPELRPRLRASLMLLMMTLPKSFMKHIADRMACGLAIILRASYHYFESANEWGFMGDTLDMLANYASARVFVFDGIASTVEYALPNADLEESKSSVNSEDDRPPMSKEATGALARILTRFVLGFYQGEMSLTVPAMLCLEKLYRNKVDLLLQAEAAKVIKEGKDAVSVDPLIAAPDQDFWQNMAVAVYSVCRSPDPEVSRHGLECYQRIILTTAVDQIPDEKWIAILYLMVNKQPPVVADMSRGNTFSALEQLLLAVVPDLSHRSDNTDDLMDLIGQTAALARENLRQGRRGSVTPLFEKTLTSVTNLSNHLMTDERKGEAEFCRWASETLLAELEKVGAAGASTKNQAATKPAVASHASQPSPDDDEEEDEESVTEGDEAGDDEESMTETEEEAD